MLATCQAIPNGVLCFFPSWGLLNAARDQWLVTGMCAWPNGHFYAILNMMPIEIASSQW